MMRRTAALVLVGVTVAGCTAGGSTGPDDPAEGWMSDHASAHWWMSVIAPAADDRWVVGGTATEGSILHDAGDGFVPVDHGHTVPLLNWIQRFDDGQMIVVGNAGTVLRFEQSAWVNDSIATDGDLWGVWGASSGDVWAVGGSESTGPLIFRDRGEGFVPMDLPDLQRPGVDVLFKVWGSGPDDVYVVGQNGAVLHWNGTVLEELHIGLGEDLIGVWGTGPDRVVAVGGRINGVAALWDGSSWRTVKIGDLPGLNGVWFSDDTVTIVGATGTIGSLDFPTGDVEWGRFDTPVFLHAVTGSPDGTLTTVGGDFRTGPSGPYRGEILTRAP